MLNWISGLTSDGRLDGSMHNAEAAVKALGIQWFAADHEAKLACGQLVIEAIQKLIPNYDLSRNLYSQFSSSRRTSPPRILRKAQSGLAKQRRRRTKTRPYLLP
jgi:hypothetical protein